MKKTLLMLLFPFFVCLLITPLIAQTPFDWMDLNKDGNLSKSEFKGPSPAFQRMDRNRDGYITRQEAAGTRILKNAAHVKKQANKLSTRESTELIYVDTHNHLVSRRTMGRYDFEKSVRIALTSMDEAGVKLNLLMPMPQAENQKIKLYFEDLLQVVETYPNRFAALGGGGTLNLMIQQAVKEGRVTEAMEKKFHDRALELVRKGAVGFGEMTAEHFSMDDDHPYETAPPDHPLFLMLADLAAQYGLPIDLHMEAITEAMPMPPRFQSPPNPSVLTPNIHALERLLAHNRKAKIIWVHLGWDNTKKRTIALTRRLLRENPNLYMSLRIASGMQKRKVVSPTFPLDEKGSLKPEWLALFQEFSKQFLLGSDEIIKQTGNHPSAGSIRSTVSLLEQLPLDLRSQIGYENAYALYKLPK